MLHLVTYTGSITNSANLTQINILQTLFENVQNNGLLVGALGTPVKADVFGASMARAQLRAPSLQQAGFWSDIHPTRKGAIAANILPNGIDLRSSGIVFKPNESVQVFAVNGGGAPEQEYAALLMCDSLPQPVATPYKTVRFTGTTTLVANALTQAFLTPEQNMPAGKYSIVGARMKTATGVFFRLGTATTPTRPGGVCVTADESPDPPLLRGGALGVWFTFNNTDTLVAEVMATAGDTAETLEVDLVGPQ